MVSMLAISYFLGVFLQEIGWSLLVQTQTRFNFFNPIFWKLEFELETLCGAS